jgi:Cu2+-exporting ATPase
MTESAAADSVGVSRCARCPHCGAAVEGAEDAFCCHGCELAARIIRDAGLERYYAEREAYAPRPSGQSIGWRAAPLEERPDGTCEARLHIDGLRCASCVWVTENVLAATPGVVEATVSYATGRATVRWDPAATDLDGVANRIAALGYRPRPLGEERAPDRDLLVRLGVATFAALNVMLISVSLYLGWFSGMAPRFVALFQWASLALATPVALWCAEPFYRGAIGGLRHRVLHMDLPIALAVAVLYGHGAWVTFAGGDAYLDSLTMLVALLLAGRVLESRGRRRAAEAAVALAASLPGTARRKSGSAMETVAAAELGIGDVIVVGPGEEVAADGVVTGGRGSLNRALVTGEAEPVEIAAGDRVTAGTALLDGGLEVTVEAAGHDTLIQRMAAQLRESADRGARPDAADRIAPWFTAATLAVATVTFAIWLGAGGTGRALEATVAVLVVACPCALALSRPLAAAAGLGAAARRGIFFRSADALLDLASVDVMALDKTGTVTEGEIQVTEASDEAIRIAAGLERFSVHPVARAIVNEAVRRGIPLPLAGEVVETAGRGVAGVVGGRRWSLGSGGPRELVLESGPERRTIRIGDVSRADSGLVVAGLRAAGLRVAMLSGDRRDVAERVAADAGIGEAVAEVGPEEKAAWIRSRRAEGDRIAFVGDGLNDGPALGAADVGVAMGTGTATSVLVADAVIAERTLRPVLSAVRAARACRRAVRVSQTRSIVYNVLAVGAAAAGWVNPLVAAVLMPLSSGMVIWTASRVEAAVHKAES